MAVDLPPLHTAHLVSFAMGVGGARKLLREGGISVADLVRDLRFDLEFMTEDEAPTARQVIKAFFPALKV